MRFDPKPYIEWDHGVTKRKIQSNTCANVLTIHINPETLDDEGFVEEMKSAMFDSLGFGQL